MNQTTLLRTHSSLPHHLPPTTLSTDNLHHMEVAGMQVDIRYKAGAPSLQQKVIQLCNQSLEC